MTEMKWGKGGLGLDYIGFKVVVHVWLVALGRLKVWVVGSDL